MAIGPMRGYVIKKKKKKKKFPKSQYQRKIPYVVEAPTTVAHLIWVVHKSHGGNHYCIDVAVCAGESKRGKGRKARIGGIVLRARRSCVGGFCN